VKRLLFALLLSTSAAAHAQSLSKALVVPTCAQGRELEQAGPGLQQLTMDTQGRLCAAATNAGSTNMVTPLMVNTIAIPLAVTTYGINFFGSNWNVPTLRGAPTPIAGTVSGLTVHNQTAVATSYFLIALSVNGVATALQCSIGVGSGPNLGTPTGCTDRTDSIDVHAGDILAWQSTVPGGLPTTPGAMSISGLFTSQNGQESLLGSATNNFISVTGITYIGPSGQAGYVNEYQASVIMPTNGVIDHLNISLSNAPTTYSVQFTVFKNGAPTGIVALCTNVTGAKCTDLTHALSVAAEDTISVQICPSNVAGCPAGAAIPNITMSFGLRWQPAIADEALVFNGSVNNSSTTNYAPIAGGYAANPSEAFFQNPAPIAMTLGNLLAAQCPDISATTSRTVTLRSNGVSQAPTVLMPPGTGVCPSLTIAPQDTIHTAQVITDQLLNFLTVPTGGGQNPLFKTSMTATVP